MELVKNLREVKKKDVSIVGGKGVSLGEMIKFGIDVPPGFVILSTSFDVFLKEAKLKNKIDLILQNANYKKIDDIEKISKQIKSMIVRADIPLNIEKEIKKYFKKLNTRYVAIRSSATAEDSSKTTWAGQLDSFLNTTDDDLLDNIKKCWASFFNARAISYRSENNLNGRKISVAVVVQKMIQSEKSGVSFSADPISGDRGVLTIEAGFGLGEAIVSGQITPDNYNVQKNNLKILSKNVNRQKKLLTHSKGRGNNWETVENEKQKQQKLSDGEILQLSKLVLKIERRSHFPVDVEWAKEKNKFYITQSRPITSLLRNVKNKQNVLDYIKTQKWFSRERTDTALLLNSAKRTNYIKYIKKDYGIPFAETMLVPIIKNKPVRVFNLQQAKRFHLVSQGKILNEPKILISYIKKDNLIYQNIEKYGEKLAASIKSDNYLASIKLFNKIIDLYEISCAHFIIIFSLGLKLNENKNKFKNFKELTKEHDMWRNSVAFKEEDMNKKLLLFFKFIIKKKKSTLNPLFLIKYLTVEDIKAWVDKKISNNEIENIIKLRKNDGFIYLNLVNKRCKIVDDTNEVNKIRKYFLQFNRESRELKNKNQIIGQIAYDSEKNIKGRVLIIKDKRELKNKKDLIKNKILVAIQTTPHYIPYLKKAKAIITDEGGVTCHAAILAREFKIPCLVGTKMATHILKDDELIEIDIIRGTVIIIK